MNVLRTTRILGLAVAACLTLSARPTFPKAAKEAKIEGITCMTCHKGVPKKGGEFTEKGKALHATKKGDKAITDAEAVAFLKK